MNDKSILLSEAMGYIADEYLEEAHPEISENISAKHRHLHIGYRIALAASLCLVAMGTLYFVLSSPELFTNALKGDAVAPEADCPISDGIIPDGNSGNSVGTIVGTTGTSSEDSTTQEAEEETTTGDTTYEETQAFAPSEAS